MDQGTRTGGPAVGEDRRGPDEIRADIEHTREELGETVEALAAKTDIKRQAEAKVEDTKHRVNAKVDALKRAAADNPATVRTIGVVAVAVMIGVILARR
jgi:hypothetical protein